MKKSKKTLILSSIIIVVVLAIVLVAVMLNRGHRVIKVESVEGEVVLERKAKEMVVLAGMNLQTEDMVTTRADGLLGLVADEDKYIAAMENTCFEIVSKGTEKNGKLEIKLKYGTALIEIENKLPEEASFEVLTPNAALGVRGTIFEVTYLPESNTTVLIVTEGKVEVETASETQMVSAGGMAIITDEHITTATADSMAQVMQTIIPGEDGGNEPVGGGLNGGSTYKEYIDLDELTALLKGSPDRGTLGHLLAVAKQCQDEGNEDYISAALKQMCYTTSDAGLFCPIAQEAGAHIYDMATLNKAFSFFSDEKIGEEHLYLDSYIDGDRVVCVQPDGLSLEEGVSAVVIEAYYGENNEIIVCGSYNVIYYADMSSKVEYLTVHLIPDEDRKYIFGYIE